MDCVDEDEDIEESFDVSEIKHSNENTNNIDSMHGNEEDELQCLPEHDRQLIESLIAKTKDLDKRLKVLETAFQPLLAYNDAKKKNLNHQ